MSNSGLFDSHCHLFTCSDDEYTAVLDRAKRAGLTETVNLGVDLNSSLTVCRQSNIPASIPVYHSVGISPEKAPAARQADEQFSALESLINDTSPVAVGEIGLDRVNTAYPDIAQQIRSFRQQLALAKKYELPVVLHSRGAEEEALEILQEEHVQKALFHCYTGSADTAERICKAGYSISFSGIITFKNADFDTVLRRVDSENILVETDSPYLSPEPLRGRPNEPAHLIHTAAYAAYIRGESTESFRKITRSNGLRFFKISSF
ncbi:MAG: TatD family hydrolase [Fibrobacterota bacterium]